MHHPAQHNHLVSERSIFGFKPALRLEWRDQDGKDKTQQRDHCALTLGDSLPQSIRIRFSVHSHRGLEHSVRGTFPVRASGPITWQVALRLRSSLMKRSAEKKGPLKICRACTSKLAVNLLVAGSMDFGAPSTRLPPIALI
jgi:hypothetical protein